MAEAALEAEVRENAGKGVARKLRAAGRIPAVVYGYETEVQSLSVDGKALMDLLEGSDAGINTLIALKVGGAKGSTTVMVRELQRDPLSGKAIHADLCAIDATNTIQVSVPVNLTGVSIGVRDSGGVLDHMMREVEVTCLPNAIPEHLELDISSLEIGDMLHVSDITLPDGATLVTDEGVGIATVHAPRAEEEVVVEEVEGEEVEGEEGAPAEGEAEAEAEKSTEE